MDPMAVLHPNHMGTHTMNTGIESIKANYGSGVLEAKKTTGQPHNVHLHEFRKAKAREFGRQIHEVGF